MISAQLYNNMHPILLQVIETAKIADKAADTLLEKGLTGVIAIIALSGLVFFYKKLDDAIKENKLSAKENFDNQVKENGVLYMEIKELRLKQEIMMSENIKTLQDVVQKNTAALEKNSEIMDRLKFKLNEK